MMNYKVHADKLKRFSMKPFFNSYSSDEDESNLSSKNAVPNDSINHPYSSEELEQFKNQYFQPSTRKNPMLTNRSGRSNTVRASLNLDRLGNEEKMKAEREGGVRERVGNKISRPVSLFVPSTYQPPGLNHLSIKDSLSGLTPDVIAAITSNLPTILPGESGTSSNVGSQVSTDSLLATADALLLQLLISQTLNETKPLEILSLEKLDQLHREKDMNRSKVEALSSKLMLETKVREGAKSLMKLHANNKVVVGQAQLQVNSANLKLEEISKEIWKLINRSWNIDSSLSKHNSSVLALGYQRQGKQLAQLKDSTKLRSGQIAVMELESDQDNIIGLRSNSGISDQGLNNLSNAELQERLTDALNLIDTQQNQIDRLKKDQRPKENYQPDLGDLFEKLEKSQARIQELEQNLNTHITSKSNISIPTTPIEPSLPVPTEKLHELEDQFSTSQNRVMELETELVQVRQQLTEVNYDHHQLLLILEELYTEIPDFDIEHPEGQQEEGQEKGGDTQFDIAGFIDKVDLLMQENHDLIDKVLDLQYAHHQLQTQLKNIGSVAQENNEDLSDCEKEARSEGQEAK